MYQAEVLASLGVKSTAWKEKAQSGIVRKPLPNKWHLLHGRGGKECTLACNVTWYIY